MRSPLVFCVIVCASIVPLSFAQTAHEPATSQHPGRDRAHAEGEARPAAVQYSGSSLLKTTLANQADPAQAKLSSISFFAVQPPEPRTMKKHDLVTIIIREQSEFSSEGNSDLKKSADIDAKIDQFVRLNLHQWTLENSVQGASPEIKASGNRNFKGEATVDRTDSLTARITAEVVDVKPNGTLVLQARTHIKTDEEEQTLVLSGTCRAEDILADNTILSTQLHDKDVTKIHKGAVRDTTKRGIIPKLLDWLNPF